MPSLTEILKSLFDISNILEATDEQLKQASEIMQGQQREAFKDSGTRAAWGFRGKTPEEQRAIDEKRGPVRPGRGGESKG